MTIYSWKETQYLIMKDRVSQLERLKARIECDIMDAEYRCSRHQDRVNREKKRKELDK